MTYILPNAAGNEVHISNFQMYHLTSKGDETTCQEYQRKTRLGCVVLCGQTHSCDAVYAEDLDALGWQLGYWRCLLCSAVWDVSTLQPGLGYYGVAGMSFSIPPPMEGTDLISVGIELGVLTATRRCRGNGKNMKTALDSNTGKWPRIPGACQANMCNQESVLETLVTVTQGISTVLFQGRCRHHERQHGYTACSDTGTWQYYDKTRTLCLPTTCGKRNSLNRDVYVGTQNTTINGRNCIPWASVSFGTYPEDDGDVVAASNYCRDTDFTGKVWCFVSFPSYEFCDIPDCV